MIRLFAKLKVYSSHLLISEDNPFGDLPIRYSLIADFVLCGCMPHMHTCANSDSTLWMSSLQSVSTQNQKRRKAINLHIVMRLPNLSLVRRNGIRREISCGQKFTFARNDQLEIGSEICSFGTGFERKQCCLDGCKTKLFKFFEQYLIKTVNRKKFLEVSTVNNYAKWTPVLKRTTQVWKLVLMKSDCIQPKNRCRGIMCCRARWLRDTEMENEVETRHLYLTDWWETQERSKVFHISWWSPGLNMWWSWPHQLLMYWTCHLKPKFLKLHKTQNNECNKIYFQSCLFSALNSKFICCLQATSRK